MANPHSLAAQLEVIEPQQERKLKLLTSLLQDRFPVTRAPASSHLDLNTS